MKKSFAIMVALGLLCSCGGERVTIEGEFAACPNQSVVLEGVGANGTIEGDTLATTNNNGQFRLRISLPNNESSFYNLRCAERTIPLILSKGERVVVNSVPGLIDGYTVSGSKESELVREVKNIMRFGVAKLDSLATIYEKTSAKALQKTINDEYKKVYLDIKRSQIEFIVTHAGQLAAIYALNQQIPGDVSLFGGKNDIVYFRLVADEVAKNYPNSPYLAGLNAAIDEYDRAVEFNNLIEEALAAEPANFPEIEISDMYGKKQSLTEVQKGKVLLLDFWTVGDENAPFRNAELKELYAKYHDKGFEIYQVSVDTSKPAWVEIVQRQKLPWISVCDFKGAGSPAVQLFGIASVPQNFLFDREGNIVARNAYGDNLTGELTKLFK
ncbi:MAG: TlpA family protein disulfide reductase [Tidjanibacter sp.]|nr:TlpA family protein disulfide reductase [Tidjanibacter sp.]